MQVRAMTAVGNEKGARASTHIHTQRSLVYQAKNEHLCGVRSGQKLVHMKRYHLFVC